MFSAPVMEAEDEGMSIKRMIMMGVISACFGMGLFAICVWIAKMIWNS